MSSDLFLLDCSVFADPFSPIDNIFQENYINQSNPTDEIDQITFDHLSLSQMPTTFADFNALLQVKTEDSQFPNYSAFDYSNNNYNNHSFLDTNAYGGTMKMQRSFSSNCFEGHSSLLFQPQFDVLMESPNLESFSSPENSSCPITQMRRICSAGDLQGMKTSQTRARLSCSPLGTESSFMEEANSKVLRYSAEERKERIHRYKTKRTQRNFNKTIKYACRKTLADSRPRIRGRFARNDESGEAQKTAPFNRYEEDDDFWIEGFQMHDQEQDEGALFKSYGVQ